ncbi:D-beta-hydroxybutyrate dehydrogenase, mitochondrial-like [Neocloeon triangulifer]|uniref:D-beta-hydroxybutyrate dehydrogenase, mitochondrial-like n=1 Tax=Neocloeon triangulifer TaxID=2078957 RepID=UPI00286F0E00|nr:D-beta-hydroxybutyrate dehydrogenase, mitochondrial-like [Neocloeon triangulifer]
MERIDKSIDGLHRASIWGFQAGIVAYVLTTVTGFLRITSICPCLAFVLFFLIGTAVAALIATLEIKPEGKAVLVTGCDSGFGYHLALRLQKLGFVVFAACLNKNGEGAKKLLKESEDKVIPVQMNVISDDEIETAFDEISEELGKRKINGLWGLVNNAGLSTFGHIEWISENDSRKVVEVNTWGVVKVTRAFLPLIRKASGRVVNVTSALGRFSAIGRSSYGMTKHAIEAFSDVLRFEIRRFGVSVSIVEPGNFIAATSLYSMDAVKDHASRMWNGMSDELKNAYGEDYFNRVFENMVNYTTKGPTDLEPALVCLTQPLVQTFPAPRYQPMELDWKIRCLVQTHLPEWIYERLYIQ